MCAMFGARRRGGRRDVSHLRMQIGETSVVFVGRCSVATVVPNLTYITYCRSTSLAFRR